MVFDNNIMVSRKLIAYIYLIGTLAISNSIELSRFYIL